MTWTYKTEFTVAIVYVVLKAEFKKAIEKVFHYDCTLMSSKIKLFVFLYLEQDDLQPILL